MAGFRNDVMYAGNVDFSGGSPVTGKVVANGQLLIGASVAPFIRVATLSSSGSTITISNGAGTINLEAGASVPTTFNADSGSATPAANILTVTGGVGATTTGSGSTLTIDVSGGGLTWNEETGASVNAAVNNGYITNNGGGVTVNLPGTFAVGDVIRVAGKAGLWIVDAPAGDTVQIGNTATSSGGTLTATNAGDCLEIVGITANTTWRVISMMGNLTVA
jgi:hypothetical protein